MMSSMVSSVDALPIFIIFWKVWYCMKMPCYYIPSDLAVDSLGNVFVADSRNYRIEKTSDDGHLIKTWGNDFHHPGTKPDEFADPSSVAVDNSGNVFVTDFTNDRIQEFTNDGKFILTWGSKGSGKGQFNHPRGVAVDSSGNVFVSDTYNSRIQKFQLSTPCPKGVTEITSGVCIIKSWGSLGTADGKFNAQYGIAVDSSGNVFVSDTSNHRIQKFNNDGTFITKWGTLGTGKGQFDTPLDVDVDKSGNVFVLDSHNGRIQKFKNDGGFIRTWNYIGSEDSPFRFPTGIAMDSKGYLYAADTFNDRIQKYSNTGGLIRIWGERGPWD